MRTAIVLFTRDLRVRDHPALAAATERAETVVPLFVRDERIRAGPNRRAFLRRALADLDAALRGLGAQLVVRGGDVVGQTVGLAREVEAEAVFVSEDVSAYAQRREARLGRELGRVRLEVFPGVTVVPPGLLTPSGNGDHFRVFTPYFRRWQEADRRAILPAPRRISRPPGLEPAPLTGDSWPGEPRLSARIHFGTVSPRELVDELPPDRVRGLAWRDFFHQLLAARPETAREDLRSRGDRWRESERDLRAWKEGRTGYPIVDAGMRQLAEEGWISNRARMIVASFLTKDLYLDWRAGADHFFELLVDGDVANNVGNWQWVAGTGADPRPNRVINPTLQAKRFDPAGTYARRWIPELGTRDYPPPIVDHAAAVERFRAARG
jgi:deoxyribodipyrimidine photo-lyase